MLLLFFTIACWFSFQSSLQDEDVEEGEGKQTGGRGNVRGENGWVDETDVTEWNFSYPRL